MRILWQLAKGGGAALVLLWGCYLLFNKRAGIVLLHAGIGLLLANELVVDLFVNEGNMAITEGETTNYSYDIREAELAFILNEGDLRQSNFATRKDAQKECQVGPEDL